MKSLQIRRLAFYFNNSKVFLLVQNRQLQSFNAVRTSTRLVWSVINGKFDEW